MMDIPEGMQLTPFDQTFQQDPYAVYRRLRQAAPIHQESRSIYPVDSWTVSSHTLVNQLLRDPRLSADAASVGMPRDPRADNAVTRRTPDMMNLDGDEHRRLRASVQRAFTPASAERIRPRVAQVFDDCADGLSDEFDFVKEIAAPLPTIVIAEYLGFDSADHARVKQWTDDLLLQGYPMPTAAQWDTIVAADASLRAYAAGVVEDRRTQPRGDLVSRLVLDERLSIDEIVDMCVLLLGAGNFTTTDLISNALLAMLLDDAPKVDPKVVVEETLRFDPPSMAVRRFAVEDIEVANVTIRAGSVVTMLLGAANHDPSVFDTPDLFRTDRPAGQHLAFGRGVHHCLGASLARMEAEVVLERLTERWPNMHLLDAVRTKRMSFRGCTRLLVSVSAG